MWAPRKPRSDIRAAAHQAGAFFLSGNIESIGKLTDQPARTPLFPLVSPGVRLVEVHARRRWGAEASVRHQLGLLLLSERPYASTFSWSVSRERSSRRKRERVCCANKKERPAAGPGLRWDPKVLRQSEIIVQSPLHVPVLPIAQEMSWAVIDSSHVPDPPAQEHSHTPMPPLVT